VSLILEALRKSEAERQRGQTPDLFTATVRGTAPSRSVRAPQSLWWWLVVPALGLAVWALTQRASDAQGVSSEQHAMPAADATTEQAAPAPLAARPLASTPPRAVAATDAGSSASTTADAPTRSAVETQHDAAAEVQPVDPDEWMARVAQTGSTADIDGAVARAPRAQPPMESVPRAPAPLPAPPRTQSQGDNVALSDLAAAEREQLPPLKMSMHLWAPEPERRFVILDGNRVGEGDRVGNVVVEAITADGAVIAWQGRRIVLPMR